MKNAKLVCFSFVNRTKLTRFAVSQYVAEIPLSMIIEWFNKRPGYKTISLTNRYNLTHTFIQKVLEIYKGKDLKLDLSFCYNLKRLRVSTNFKCTMTDQFELILVDKPKNTIVMNLCGNFNILKFRNDLLPRFSAPAIVSLFLCAYWCNSPMERRFLSLINPKDIKHLSSTCKMSIAKAFQLYVVPLHETPIKGEKNIKDRTSTVVTNGMDQGVEPLVFVLNKETTSYGQVWKIKKMGSVMYILNAA